ncbi:MarR family winged helix-turn-helix transcriptional regulator [Saccharolobus islandicus]|uniref:Transcriptional regulator TrmB n=1 Tax=Saccharolobus islandicus (strain L.D.8.5 / Lassen \|nr:MarR family winged helix-turn-helix transcriptional regulator [Sulfolobus islandicus]ADB88730.1 transcriptional regulator TrmB [Sulfolobus islandicus L.D.8.5]
MLDSLSNEVKILLTLIDGKSKSRRQISKETNIPYQTVANVIARLVEYGFVELEKIEDNEKFYKITEKGLKELSESVSKEREELEKLLKIAGVVQ